MNLFAVSLRNLRVRMLSTVLTTVSIMVGTALLAALWLLMNELDRGYKSSIGGYKSVIGSKDSSSLEIVMNTVLNLGNAQGIVKLSTYEALRAGKLGPRTRVRYAIPQARGDTFSKFNYPVIGTTDEMFSAFEFGGKDEHLVFAAGEAWTFTHEDLLKFAKAKAELAEHMASHTPGDGHDHDHGAPLPLNWRRAVIGATVARSLGLGLGDEIVPVHGRKDEVGSHEHADHACAIQGILAPTNSPIDRAIYIPLGTFLSMDDHVALRDTPDVDPGDLLLTAIIAKPLDRVGDRVLEIAFQSREDGQAAVPAKEIPRLMEIVGNANKVLRVTSFLVLFVAAVSILVALYNTMNERRREIAIMRSLGARRLQILRVIVHEALLVSLIGGALGVLLCHVAVFVFGDTIAQVAGVSVDWAAFSSNEAWLVLGVGALGVVAGILPAIKGSLTEVGDNLGQLS